MSIFESSEKAHLKRAQPLAARMRPTSLGEFIGQEHFLGEGKLLRRLVDADRLGSVIFYGPPGCGKTTLAQLLAKESRSRFRQLSAVTSGVQQLRELLNASEVLENEPVERFHMELEKIGSSIKTLDSLIQS